MVWLSWVSWLVWGCSTAPPPGRVNATVQTASWQGLSETIPNDPTLEGMIAPYRSKMTAETAQVIGEARAEFTNGRPEGSLGNLIADAMLFQARALSTQAVDFALGSPGRVPRLPAGSITIGSVFELMPFDNQMVVVELMGLQMPALAREIAERSGGWPVAGLSIQYQPSEQRVTELQVQGLALDSNRVYRLVVADYYLAVGTFETLAQTRSQEPLPQRVREAIGEFIRRHKTITPQTGGRIVLRSS